MTLDQWNEYFRRAQVQGGYRLVASALFTAMPEIARCIREMGFLLWDAPDNMPFVTSDRPLGLWSLTRSSRVGVGWDNRDACGFMALSPTTYLCVSYLTPHRILRLDATPDDVVFLNEATLAQAYREAYSSQEYPQAEQWMKA